MILEYPSLLTQSFINRIEESQLLCKQNFGQNKRFGKISVLTLCPDNLYLNNYYNDDVL